MSSGRHHDHAALIAKHKSEHLLSNAALLRLGDLAWASFLIPTFGPKTYSVFYGNMQKGGTPVRRKFCKNRPGSWCTKWYIFAEHLNDQHIYKIIYSEQNALADNSRRLLM